MSTSASSLTDRDLDRLSERGIVRSEAERQLEQLRNPPPAARLERPCTVGDGIEQIDAGRLAELRARHDKAATAGEITSFVPASGAASRMFRDLLVYRDDPRTVTRTELESDRDGGRAGAPAVLEFADRLQQFAFYEPLRLAVRKRGATLDMLEPAGPYRPVFEALLNDDGLGYARLPKGLVAFHAYGEQPRTAFEEHLSEAAELYRDADGRARLHATVPADDIGRFEAVLGSAREWIASRGDARLDVEFSVQDPATDTLAVDGDGQPFRDVDGALMVRPAGHGALLRNLASVPTPIAFIKNVDNVAAEPFREATRVWVRALVGRLIELRESGERPDDRPLRVCGVVPNTGEPGGGPFWVRDEQGHVSCQIVESSQVDLDDPTQRGAWSRATHFNPVFMACLLDDARGRRHRLDRFVDPRSAIVTRRSSGGRELKALERPGLWNGAMAGWDTVFVEVPLGVFNPVKTVNDLLRDEHQPRRG